MSEKSEHATELREKVEYRLNQSFCIEPGCEYNGKPAVQGICFHRPAGDTDRMIARWGTHAHKWLEDEKALAGTAPDAYLRRLESMFLWFAMTEKFHMEEVIILRRDKAKLEAEIAALKGSTAQ